MDKKSGVITMLPTNISDGTYEIKGKVIDE